MAATVKHVALLAGVSVATVSRVINGATNVSDKTRNRVSSAICHLQFRPNLNAAALRRNDAAPDNQRGTPGSASGHPRSDSRFEVQDIRDGIITSDDLIAENVRLTQLISDLSRDLEKWKKLIEIYGSIGEEKVARRLKR
jgi:hypothetical protein